MKFIHAADIHLDSPLKGLEAYEGAPVDEIRGASRRALENLVRLAMDEKVDFVMIAGDLYDGDWKDHNTGLFVVRQMGRLREAEIPVFIIRGNHDAENKMTRSLRMPDNVLMFSAKKPQTKVLPDLDVAIHGRSFAQAAESENLSLEYPRGDRGLFNIGLLHTSLDGRQGHATYAPCSASDLAAKGYQYWALGHVHQREELTADETPIVFPGNLQGRHIRESGGKGCQLVCVNDAGDITMEFRQLDVLRWQRVAVDCSAADFGDDILDLCGDQLQTALDDADGLPVAARVELCGATAAHDQLLARPVDWANQIRAAAIDVSDGQMWIEKVKFQTTARRDQDEFSTDGPIAELVQYIDELKNDEAELAALAQHLTPLLRKLPGEIVTGEEALAFDEPQQLVDLLTQVQPLLIERLQHQEATA